MSSPAQHTTSRSLAKRSRTPPPSAPAAKLLTAPAENDPPSADEDRDLKAFSEILLKAMLEKKLNISDVARKMFGTVKDYRGFTVAKNRDRVGLYLHGKSYPNAENLKKLAEALDLRVEDLQAQKPSIGITRQKMSEKTDLQISILAAQPDRAALQMSGAIILPTEGAIEVAALIAKWRQKV